MRVYRPFGQNTRVIILWLVAFWSPKKADIASFKTPGLRNVLITEPYFHDGSQATLWDGLDHYNKGDGIKDPWLDEDMQRDMARAFGPKPVQPKASMNCAAMEPAPMPKSRLK
jgi:cytochrome c peroxidase